MKVLLVTDSFPPVCGGSGWSTYELAAGLRARGHAVFVIKVTAGPSGHDATTEYDGLPVNELHFYAPTVPGIRNYFKNERLYTRLTPGLERLIRDDGIDVIHGQHVLSIPPAVAAARRAGIPSVATIRDYWPVCYRSDLTHTTETLAWCPGCAQAAAVQHGRPNIGAAGLATLLLRKYLRANLRMKQQALVSADAVIAVSSTIAADLHSRIPELSPSRLHLIPNPVNTEAVRRRALPERPIASAYALYVGKLAPNKGSSFLPEVLNRAQLDWPLVIVGDGPDRASLERAAAASGHDVRFVGWQDPSATATWMAHAGMLIFPSHGPESLSRVLIEASALGVPIAAMHTGGTADILEDEVSGLLSKTPGELATDVKRLRHDGELRRRLGEAAAARAQSTFEAASVVEKIETLYLALLAASKGGR